ncbi:hypothetical protein ACH427_15675 [Streptomyces sp. NPDC020379]|uniref:hypothetical protein n=1 Tax=Streptomyces sp. NPDC020379 TaxID=3365071 RepID=UPI00379FE439
MGCGENLLRSGALLRLAAVSGSAAVYAPTGSSPAPRDIALGFSAETAHATAVALYPLTDMVRDGGPVRGEVEFDVYGRSPLLCVS